LKRTYYYISGWGKQTSQFAKFYLKITRYMIFPSFLNIYLLLVVVGSITFKKRASKMIKLTFIQFQ